MLQVFGTSCDLTGNLLSMAGIFPDQLTPVVRSDREGAHELIQMR